MARFRGILVGQSGNPITRLGQHGLAVHADGWHEGISVHAGVDSEGRNTFNVSLTGGSTGNWKRNLVFIDGEGIVHHTVKDGDDFTVRDKAVL